MSLIFIDANIYLRFFDSNSREYRALLNTLKDQEITCNLFVTEQIVNEVNRNKLAVAARSMNQYRKRVAKPPPKVAFPIHFGTNGDAPEEEWNREYRSWIGDHGKLKEDFEDGAEKLVTSISRSEDEVSKSLAGVFSGALTPTPSSIATHGSIVPC